jgi:hypothetical protein
MLSVCVLALAAAWLAIEWLHLPRITVFQPFRLATVARGLALVLIAGRLVQLWECGDLLSRERALLVAAGFLGDWMLVAVTIVESAVAGAETLRLPRRGIVGMFMALLAYALWFLSRHDTESGHWPLLAVLIGGLLVPRWMNSIRVRFPKRGLLRWGLAAAWATPLLALFAGLLLSRYPALESGWLRALVARCRFVEFPIDDIERLALWCREHTPESAHFVGPPGPKAFRLWSRRSLAFNRAGSPYHAAGLADWFARFQDHVGLHYSPEKFVQKYLGARHEVEARYDALSCFELAQLARRQGADFVVCLESGPREGAQREVPGPLSVLHQEGRYAVCRVQPEWLAHAFSGQEAVQRQQ